MSAPPSQSSPDETSPSANPYDPTPGRAEPMSARVAAMLVVALGAAWAGGFAQHPELATPAAITMAGGMLLSTWTDSRTQKIKNVVTFPMMLAGLGLGLAGGTFVESLLGVVILFAVFYAAFAVGMMAAGDGKLMMGVGALMGWRLGMEATLAMLVIFIPVGLIILTLRGRLTNLGHTALYAYRRMALGDKEGKVPEQTYIPHAPSLTIGALIACFTDWFLFF